MRQIHERIVDATRMPGTLGDEWFQHTFLPMVQLYGAILRGSRIAIRKGDPHYPFFQEHLPGDAWTYIEVAGEGVLQEVAPQSEEEHKGERLMEEITLQAFQLRPKDQIQYVSQWTPVTRVVDSDPLSSRKTVTLHIMFAREHSEVIQLPRALSLQVRRPPELPSHELTKYMISEYLRNRGNTCPYCNSAGVRHVNDPRKDGDEYVVQDMECPACDSRWHDAYVLSTIMEVEPKTEEHPYAPGFVPDTRPKEEPDGD
jgi:hypothetical protein